MGNLDKSYRRRVPIENMTEAEDRLMGMVLALTSQFAAMRERIDTLETLLEKSGTLAPDAIERAQFSPEDEQRRDHLRQSLIAKVMRPILDEMERDAERAGDAE